MDKDFKGIFKEGDVVKSKSGGPLMTVEKYRKDVVKCVWFSGNEVRRDFFRQETLVLVIDKPKKEKE